MRPGRWLGWSLAAVFLSAFGALLATSDAEPIRAFAAVDFYDYYYAAEAVRSGVDPYDAAWAHARGVADGVPVIEGSNYIYPAWFAAVLTPLTALPPRVAASLWYVLSAVVLLVLLGRLAPAPRQRWLALGLLFPPALFSLFVGQVNIVLLALLVWSWEGRDRRPATAGALLGLAAAIKLTPALLLLVPLFRRRYRFVTAAAFVGLACISLGELAAPGSSAGFLRHVVPDVGVLDVRHAHPANQSISALFLRLFTENDWTVPWINAPELARALSGVVSAALVGVAGWTAWRARAGYASDEARAWAVGIAVLVVVSPLAWEATFVLTLLAMSLLLLNGVRARWLAAAWLLIAAPRALNDFAAHPDSYPFLQHVPPLTSLATLATLFLVAVAATGRRITEPQSGPAPARP